MARLGRSFARYQLGSPVVVNAGPIADGGTVAVAVAASDAEALVDAGAATATVALAEADRPVDLGSASLSLAGSLGGEEFFDAGAAAIVLFPSQAGVPQIVGASPLVKGRPRVGGYLSCWPGAWSGDPSSYGFQWQRDVAGNGVFTNIAGATNSYYLLQVADRGNQVACVVTATNSIGTGQGATAILGFGGPPPVLIGAAYGGPIEDVAPLPEILVQIDFTAQPFAAPVPAANWTDVTAYARGSYTARFGRSNELDQIEAGNLSLTLESSLDRRFEPEYGGSPYYPNVVPMRRIRVQEVFGPGVITSRFAGYVQQWPPAWPDYRRERVQFTAVDGFEVLSQDELASTLPSALSGSQMAGLLTTLNRYFPQVVRYGPTAYWMFSDEPTVVAPDTWQIASGGVWSGGTFVVTVDGQTTAAIPYNATGRAVAAAIAALPNVGVGGVTVSGGPMPGTVTVAFGGALAASEHNVTVDASGVTGTSPTVTVTHTLANASDSSGNLLPVGTYRGSAGPAGAVTAAQGFKLGQPTPIKSGSDASLLLDGASGYVSFPNSSLLDQVVGTWTLMAWVQPTAARNSTATDPNGDAAAVVTKAMPNAAPFWVPFCLGYGARLDVVPTGQVTANAPGAASRLWGGFYVNGLGWAAVFDTADAPLNTWTHVAVSYDGTYLSLYRNGALIRSIAPGHGISPQLAAAQGAYVGRRWDGGGGAPFFPGGLYGVAVYPFALTGAQIGGVYNAGLQGPPWPGPTALDAGEETMVGVVASAAQTQSLLQLIQGISDSEYGIGFVASDGTFTFHDRDHRVNSTRSTSPQVILGDGGPGSGEIPYVTPTPDYDVQRVYDEVQVTSGVQNAQPQIALDLVDQRQFSRRVLTRSTSLNSDQAAADQAARILARYKDPHFRFPQVTIDPLKAAQTYGVGAWPLLLGLRLSDRITLRRRVYSGGPMLSVDCYIEAIQHDVSFGEGGANRSWLITLALTLADPIKYWQMDSPTQSQLDSSTIFR